MVEEVDELDFGTQLEEDIDSPHPLVNPLQDEDRHQEYDFDADGADDEVIDIMNADEEELPHIPYAPAPTYAPDENMDDREDEISLPGGEDEEEMAPTTWDDSQAGAAPHQDVGDFLGSPSTTTRTPTADAPSIVRANSGSQIGKLNLALPPKPVDVATLKIHPRNPILVEAKSMLADNDPRLPRNRPRSDSHKLPPGWETRQSKSGEGTYYFNVNTEESTWKRPGTYTTKVSKETLPAVVAAQTSSPTTYGIRPVSPTRNEGSLPVVGEPHSPIHKRDPVPGKRYDHYSPERDRGRGRGRGRDDRGRDDAADRDEGGRARGRERDKDRDGPSLLGDIQAGAPRRYDHYSPPRAAERSSYRRSQSPPARRGRTRTPPPQRDRSPRPTRSRSPVPRARTPPPRVRTPPASASTAYKRPRSPTSQDEYPARGAYRSRSMDRERPTEHPPYKRVRDDTETRGGNDGYRRQTAIEPYRNSSNAGATRDDDTARSIPTAPIRRRSPPVQEAPHRTALRATPRESSAPPPPRREQAPYINSNAYPNHNNAPRPNGSGYMPIDPPAAAPPPALARPTYDSYRPQAEYDREGDSKRLPPRVEPEANASRGYRSPPRDGYNRSEVKENDTPSLPRPRGPPLPPQDARFQEANAAYASPAQTRAPAVQASIPDSQRPYNNTSPTNLRPTEPPAGPRAGTHPRGGFGNHFNAGGSTSFRGRGTFPTHARGASFGDRGRPFTNANSIAGRSFLSATEEIALLPSGPKASRDAYQRDRNGTQPYDRLQSYSGPPATAQSTPAATIERAAPAYNTAASAWPSSRPDEGGFRGRQQSGLVSATLPRNESSAVPVPAMTEPRWQSQRKEQNGYDNAGGYRPPFIHRQSDSTRGGRTNHFQETRSNTQRNEYPERDARDERDRVPLDMIDRAPVEAARRSLERDTGRGVTDRAKWEADDAEAERLRRLALDSKRASQEKDRYPQDQRKPRWDPPVSQDTRNSHYARSPSPRHGASVDTSHMDKRPQSYQSGPAPLDIPQTGRYDGTGRPSTAPAYADTQYNRRAPPTVRTEPSATPYASTESPRNYPSSAVEASGSTWQGDRNRSYGFSRTRERDSTSQPFNVDSLRNDLPGSDRAAPYRSDRNDVSTNHSSHYDRDPYKEDRKLTPSVLVPSRVEDGRQTVTNETRRQEYEGPVNESRGSRPVAIQRPSRFQSDRNDKQYTSYERPVATDNSRVESASASASVPEDFYKLPAEPQEARSSVARTATPLSRHHPVKASNTTDPSYGDGGPLANGRGDWNGGRGGRGRGRGSFRGRGDVNHYSQQESRTHDNHERPQHQSLLERLSVPGGSDDRIGVTPSLSERIQPPTEDTPQFTPGADDSYRGGKKWRGRGGRGRGRARGM